MGSGGSKIKAVSSFLEALNFNPIFIQTPCGQTWITIADFQFELLRGGRQGRQDVSNLEVECLCVLLELSKWLMEPTDEGYSYSYAVRLLNDLRL
ncbi:MAG: hypothetical protein ACI80P_001123 [Flavobacteriales bacterium]